MRSSAEQSQPRNYRLGPLLLHPLFDAHCDSQLGGSLPGNRSWLALQTETLVVAHFEVDPSNSSDWLPQPGDADVAASALLRKGLDLEAQRELLEWANSCANSTPAQFGTRRSTWPETRPSTRASDGASQDEQAHAAIETLTINVTQVCNLGCSYCAAGGDGTYGSRVKTPDLDLVYGQVRSALAVTEADRLRPRAFTITFLGGEPLLHPKIVRAIAQYARLQTVGTHIELQFSIVTNATLVTSQVVELLADLRAHVTVSIDGPPELNGRARVTKSGKNSTAATLNGLSLLAASRERLGSLTVGAVLGAHHCDPMQSYQFFRTLAIDSVKFDFAAHEGDEALSRHYAEQMAELAENVFSSGGEAELRRISTFNHLFHVLDHRLPVQNHCLAGQGHMQVDTEGNWTTCQWFIGSQAENVGHGERFDTAKLEQWSGSLIDKHGCQNCWAKHICGGGCQFVNKVKTKNKNTRDLAFCERTRIILQKGLELYAKARAAREVPQSQHLMPMASELRFVNETQEN